MMRVRCLPIIIIKQKTGGYSKEKKIYKQNKMKFVRENF